MNQLQLIAYGKAIRGRPNTTRHENISQVTTRSEQQKYMLNYQQYLVEQSFIIICIKRQMRNYSQNNNQISRNQSVHHKLNPNVPYYFTKMQELYEDKLKQFKRQIIRQVQRMQQQTKQQLRAQMKELQLRINNKMQKQFKSINQKINKMDYEINDKIDQLRQAIKQIHAILKQLIQTVYIQKQRQIPSSEILSLQDIKSQRKITSLQKFLRQQKVQTPSKLYIKMQNLSSNLCYQIMNMQEFFQARNNYRQKILKILQISASKNINHDHVLLKILQVFGVLINYLKTSTLIYRIPQIQQWITSLIYFISQRLQQKLPQIQFFIYMKADQFLQRFISIKQEKNKISKLIWKLIRKTEIEQTFIEYCTSHNIILTNQQLQIFRQMIIGFYIGGIGRQTLIAFGSKIIEIISLQATGSKYFEKIKLFHLQQWQARSVIKMIIRQIQENIVQYKKIIGTVI